MDSDDVSVLVNSTDLPDNTNAETSNSKNNSRDISANMKLNVLSNEKISLPQNYITEMLRNSITEIPNSKEALNNTPFLKEKIVYTKVANSNSNKIETDTSSSTNQTSNSTSYQSGTNPIEHQSLTDSENLDKTSPVGLVKSNTQRRGRKRKIVEYPSLGDSNEQDCIEQSEGKHKHVRSKSAKVKAKSMAAKQSNTNVKSPIVNNTFEAIADEEGDNTKKNIKNSKVVLDGTAFLKDKMIPTKIVISNSNETETYGTPTAKSNLDNSLIEQNLTGSAIIGNLNESSPLALVASNTQRKGRKRKVIDYASLAEGNQEDFTEQSETKCKSDRSISANTKAKTMAEKRCKDKSPNLNNTIETIADEKNEYTKKKKRPRGRSAKNSQQSKLLDKVFQQIRIDNPQLWTDPNGEHFESPLDTISLHTAVEIDDKTNVAVKEKLVTCAICSLQFTKLSWSHHKYRSHNNLAWKVGEPPLDLSNDTLVMSILTDLYKHKKPLHCENCGIVKKSPVGYLSHKSVCQKTDIEVTSVRIKCEYCEHTLLPVSMTAHLKYCKGLNPPNNIEIDCSEDAPNTNLCTSSIKERAAKKAANIYKELQSDHTNSAPKRVRCNWYVNFDFHPTGFGKRRINREMKANGSARCWFAECNFESSDLQAIENHIWRCDHKTIHGYTCKSCMFTFTNEEQVSEHNKQVHTKSSANNDLYEEENGGESDYESDSVHKKIKGNSYINRRFVSNGIHFLVKQRIYPASTAIRYPPALNWSFEFCKQNFSNTNLFPSWRATAEHYEKLDLNMYCKYLPPQKYSICTASIESNTYTNLLALNYQWKRYKLFEADLLHNDDLSMIFCGGSICAMAWAPTPYNLSNCEQILAISINAKFNKGYPVDQLYTEPGIIQFWNCGTLVNDHVLFEKPKLEYCIAHDHGPIWCMEWCPSGVYDQECTPERLGLLAVGSADSYVYIYAICFPNLLKGSKMYKARPLRKLALDAISEIAVNGIERHPTTFSWSKASGHQYLAVGYANGMICIFDLLSTASLLHSESNEQIQVLLPYQVFNAHHHAVTTLHLFHLNNGRRWAMSGSLDRTIKYWDLDNPMVPISNFTKFLVTDGVWLTHWLSTVHTYDDCCGGGLTYSSVHQLRNYGSDSASIMHSNSHVSSISGSEWINCFVQGNAAGEVVGFFPHQLFHNMETDKSFRKKKAILGYARVVEKNVSADERLRSSKPKSKKNEAKKPEIGPQCKVDVHSEDFPHDEYVEPSSYEEVDERYGLVFCDMNLVSLNDLPANLSSYYKSNNNEKLFPSKPTVYPLQLINKVVINPNHSSHLYYASGYQAGFVRISSLKFINKKK